MSYECKECRQVSRRDFLRRSALGLGAAAYADPLLRMLGSTYAQTAQGTGNLLVLCQLNGGMDALSFLAPYGNAVYRERRPQLALDASAVTPLPDNSTYGITNAMPTFIDLYQSGQLAVVQQAGYPDGNGSHFESQEIFEFGVRNLANAAAGTTWYERLRKLYFDEPYGVLDTRKIGNPTTYGYPDGTYRKAAQEAFGRLARLKAGDTAAQRAVLGKYDQIDRNGALLRERTAEFQSTGDRRGQFWRAAALAQAGLGTRVLKVEYGGYDTHAQQDQSHDGLFGGLDAEFAQFVADAQATGIWEKTCVLFYTEFGRRNAENGSPGTDHGHGGHMILAGPGVNGGLHGKNVTSNDMRVNNLPAYVDFRAVFSDVIGDWLGFDPDPVFKLDGEDFDPSVGSALFV